MDIGLAVIHHYGTEIDFMVRKGALVWDEATQPEPTQLELDTWWSEYIVARDAADVNQVARQYLAETDWYVTRLVESGKAIPVAIATLRAEARLKVV